MTNELLNFDELEEWSQEFIYEGNTYLAKEADGHAAERYRAASLSGSIFNTKTSDVQIGDISKTENILVGNSVFNSEGHRVGPAVVAKWKYSVVKKLFGLIKENSNLTEEDDESKPIADLIKERDRLNDIIKRRTNDTEGKSQPDTMHG